MGRSETPYDVLDPGEGIVIRRLWTTETEHRVEAARILVEVISTMQSSDIQSMSMILEGGAEAA